MCRSHATARTNVGNLPMPRPTASRKPPYDPDEATAALSAADPKLGRLIAKAGPLRLRISGSLSPFESLAESIIYQQLHGKAAAAIHARMIESFAEVCGVGVHPSPQHLLDCPTPQLRSAGLSANKTLALRDLAAETLDGTVPTLARIRRMSDDAIIDHLTQVRGIGRWTVEMMLIFRLGRPDVLPVSDYGVRKGFCTHIRRAEASGQGDAYRSAQASRDGEAGEEVASLVLGRELVSVARVRSGQARRRG